MCRRAVYPLFDHRTSRAHFCVEGQFTHFLIIEPPALTPQDPALIRLWQLLSHVAAFEVAINANSLVVEHYLPRHASRAQVAQETESGKSPGSIPDWRSNKERATTLFLEKAVCEFDGWGEFDLFPFFFCVFMSFCPPPPRPLPPEALSARSTVLWGVVLGGSGSGEQGRRGGAGKCTPPHTHTLPPASFPLSNGLPQAAHRVEHA